MADIFDVIADGTRRDILQELLDEVAAGNGEISVGDLVERLGISQPTVSKHLKVLREHGLVSVREDGQHRYYRLDAAPLEAVEDWLVPYVSLELDSPDFEGDSGSAVFSAWSGVDVGQTIGRTVAEGAHQARQVVEGVGKRLPRPLRRRPFRR